MGRLLASQPQLTSVLVTDLKDAHPIVLPTSNSSSAPVPGPCAAGPSPSAEAVKHEHAERLEQAMARLPEDYRRVILLRYQDEQTFEEIGRLMNRSPNAARKLWLRAVERLQEEMDAP